LAVKINGNRGAQQEICFNKSFKRHCTIPTGIPNLGVWCKKWSNWTSRVGVGQKMRLLMLSENLPKNSDFLRLCNPAWHCSPT